jgi:hypothetical protein
MLGFLSFEFFPIPLQFYCISKRDVWSLLDVLFDKVCNFLEGLSKFSKLPLGAPWPKSAIAWLIFSLAALGATNSCTTLTFVQLGSPNLLVVDLSWILMSLPKDLPCILSLLCSWISALLSKNVVSSKSILRDPNQAPLEVYPHTTTMIVHLWVG